VIAISEQALRKVNSIRQRAGLTEVDEEELRELLDWTDLPRSPNLTAACLPRFGQVLGFRVTNNTDGGFVYICVDSEAVALELAEAIGGWGSYWEGYVPPGPRDYVGHVVLLPEDIVRLATDASRAVRDTWYPP
jgi:hypothetical protein